MKYQIIFDNNSVEKMFMGLYHSFDWSEVNFEEKDLMRNIFNVACFDEKLKTLRLLGADTDCGTFEDDGYLRIGFAKINDHVFIKNSVINPKELKDALWEIAHPNDN